MKTNNRERFQANCLQHTKLELCVRVMCVLHFKTRVAAESLLFTYVSIRFILSVPQERAAVFLSLSAESDAVRGAERSFPNYNVSDIHMSAACLQDTFTAACL